MLSESPLYVEPQPEGEIPRLPEDLTEVSDQGLMAALKAQVEWQNFLSTKVGDAELEEAEAEAKLAYLSASTLLSGLSGEKLYKARAERDSDPEVVAAKKVLKEAKARRKALELTVQSRERSATLLSRELSRRIGREPNQRRVDRWNP